MAIRIKNWLQNKGRLKGHGFDQIGRKFETGNNTNEDKTFVMMVLDCYFGAHKNGMSLTYLFMWNFWFTDKIIDTHNPSKNITEGRY